MKVIKREFGFDTTFRARNVSFPYSITPHIHQHLEILIILRGRVRVCINGTKKTLTTRDICVIMPLSSHSIEALTEDASFWLSVFSDSVLPGVRADKELTRQREELYFTAGEELFNYIGSAVDLYDKKNTHITEDVPRVIRSVLYAIISAYITSTNASRTDTERSALSSLIIYISEHYQEDITLKRAAQALGYNPKYLSAVLSALPDVSFSTLLHSCRADLAKNLLLGTELNVIDIAYECGYKQERTFRRAFRAITGVSPSEYRNKKRGKR